MVFDKDELKRLIEEKGVKTQTDLQEMMRQMYKEVIETMLDGEMTQHLGYPKNEPGGSQNGNYRNGKSRKHVHTNAGAVDLSVPRDRAAAFEPEIVKKHQTDITGIEDKVISLYGIGTSVRDIQEQIREIYGYELSPETVSSITDKVIDLMREWKSRPLDPLYPIIFLDGLRVKVRQNGASSQCTVYIVIGYCLDGSKGCLGMYLGEAESAKFWMTILNDLKVRGVKDVLIFATDNLSGISQAINSAFPQAEIQKCIVHQIRNSLAFVSWSERKKVAVQLKEIYTAPNEQAGAEALERFTVSPFGEKYPYIAKSWYANWTELSTFYKFSPELRKLMYTTNMIERFNAGMRKVIKTKQIFPTEDSVLKLLYLAQENFMRKLKTVYNWATVMTEILAFYEERVTPYL
jgi:transposase-like protein